GSTPKTLATLVRKRDDVVNAPDDFATVSVAARGFYALEFLLFDEGFFQPEDAAFRCALLQAITADIASNAAAILANWQNEYADLITTPGNDTYRTSTEAAQQLFTALTTGLEFTETTRLGRPLGTFERPRPNRAEARRSGRSLRHVVLSLEANRELAFLIAADPALDQDFADALEAAIALDDPVFSGVADPARRFRIEVLQQRVTNLRRYLLEQVGPRFGITAGFNSLDGD
ncbi:MAG: imelysin family protein, partial [Pseudomonadota bacterium]